MHKPDCLTFIHNHTYTILHLAKRLAHRKSVSGVIALLFLVMVYCCCAPATLCAQPLSTKFTSLAGSRSFDDIQTVLLDSKNFLWFGCNEGLIRFDGSNYVQLTSETAGRTVPSNHITALYEDAAGRIWIGTADKGLFSYDYMSDSFTTKTFDTVSTFISSIQGNNDNLFVTGNTGLTIFDVKKSIGKHSTFADSIVSGQTSILECIPDPVQKNMIWLYKADGLYSYDTKNEVSKKWHSFGYSIDELNRSLKTLCVTPKGTIYTAAKNNGLVELFPASGKVTLYPFSKNVTTAYSSNNINSLLNADTTHIMVATQESGLALFDVQTKKFEFLTQNNFPESDFFRFQATSLANNNGFLVMATQHKGLWISASGVNNNFPVFPLTSIFNKVPGSLYARSIYVAENGKKIYVGSFFGDGLYVFDKTAGITRTYPFVNNGLTGKTLIINHIYADHKGNLWLSSQDNGLLLFDTTRKVIIPAKEKFPRLSAVTSSKIYCVYEDQYNNIYIATGDAGLFTYNYNSGQIHAYTHSDNDSSSILTNHLFAEKLFEDSKGDIWISTQQGITVFDPAIKKFHHFIAKPGLYNSIDPAFWYSVAQDKSDDLFIGTNDGFYQIKAGARSLQGARHLTKSQGLLHNNVYSIVTDEKNLLWITCRNGMSCYDPVNQNFRNFNYQNGLPSKTLMSPTQFANGVIYQGAVEKFFIFNTDTLLANEKQQFVWLTGLKIFDRDSIGGMYLNSLKTLEFNYQQNSFSFSFTSPSIFFPDATTYAYMLVGVDKDWKLSGNRNYASYTNIKPGTYTFKVKAAGPEGVWSNEIRSIKIIIIPPVWQRWWFILGILFLLCCLFYVLLKRREKNIAQREAAKTEVEKLRAINYQYQLEIEQVIHYFANSISIQRSADDLLWDVAKNCISKLGFEDCVIYLKDDSQSLIQKAAWGPKTTSEDKIVNPIKIPIGKGIVGTVALTGKPEIIGDTTLDDRYIVDDARRYSEIAVPILSDGKVIGVIDSEHSEKNFYTQRHLQILTTIASLYADKMDKLAAEEQTKIKEIEVIKLNRDLTSSQLTALRAQMNPHFIFNALNSIQQYILKGNVDEANKYLSKFSKLQREILNNSDQQFISMEKEIELLELYLQLEQLRFNGTFHYSIKIDGDIDAEEIRIPPMLIQPFVENAIWHGLMPKQGERFVHIAFDISDDDILCCSITDNGIGREAAARLKQITTGGNGHKSKGMGLVLERLHILQQQYRQPFEVNVSDITDSEGNITGTLVLLTVYTGSIY